LRKEGHHYGLHRVVEPAGVLPQPAWKLDATSEIWENELLIDVERLNIDSASFQQLKTEAEGDPERIKRRIVEIVKERGKMHNSVTGSGGMLIGTVAEVGSAFPDQTLAPGAKIASLVSLTLTPLWLEDVRELSLETGQLEVSGKAVLFASAPYAVLPSDMPEPVALAALDVCGAPAQTARLVQPTDTVVIMGAGGKSGLLSLYQAWKKAGQQGCVIALEANPEACRRIEAMGLAHHVVCLDATDPLQVLETVSTLTRGRLADVTINCVNVPRSELPAILATQEGGVVVFFSMAVQFTTAALGAEGVGKDVQMMIGNGYVPGHAALALESLRECPALYDWFCQRFSSQIG
jgi:L-erythro-3,5-diaminohexanoate dehydrogenase